MTKLPISPDILRIRRAYLRDLPSIIALIDDEFTKEGFGFVNKAQIETEIRRNRVLVAEAQGDIVGVRIGIDILWNLVVAREQRKLGVGSALINYTRPRTIRVKSIPVGHLSKQQREQFQDPVGFYDALGFTYWGNSYPRNFWQRAKDNKGQFHLKGKIAHIQVFKDKASLLFQ